MSKKNKTLVKPAAQKALAPHQVQAITNVENMGTAMLQSAQQMFLAVEQVLKQEFDFTQAQLQHFEQTITRMMETLAHVEEKGMTVQSIDAMRQVGELSGRIAQIRKQRLDADKNGITLPSEKEIKQLGN